MLDKIEAYWNKSTPMNFSEERWGYEKKRKFRYDLQDYMQRQFQFGKWHGKRVLEIGCGSGIDAVEFARNGAVVTCVDLTDNAINLTRQLMIDNGIEPYVLKTDATNLPFPNASFDLVYSYGVLHHIEDVDSVLSEIRRVLTRNGVLMTMLYNKDSLLYAYSIVYEHGIKENLLNKMGDDELTAKFSERNIDCPYTHAYTKSEAQTKFGQYFRSVSVDVEYNVIDTANQRKVKFSLSPEYKLGWHLIVKAYK